MGYAYILHIIAVVILHLSHGDYFAFLVHFAGDKVESFKRNNNKIRKPEMYVSNSTPSTDDDEFHSLLL